jgi:hypothetical protein
MLSKVMSGGFLAITTRGTYLVPRYGMSTVEPSDIDFLEVSLDNNRAIAALLVARLLLDSNWLSGFRGPAAAGSAPE